MIKIGDHIDLGLQKAKWTLTLCLILIYFDAYAQKTSVDYTIQCKLDENNKHIGGEMSLNIKNWSLDTIHELYFHVWMNSFSDSKSAFANQLKKTGSDKWFHLKNSERGGYQKLDFYTTKKLSFSYINHSNEILRIKLDHPIFFGDSATIKCDFSLKLPKNISRGGYIDNDFYLTQWYPKLALFDSTGWHTMPYLENGEFYNEFGNYDIEINVPNEYKVAATGSLQTLDELNYLLQFADSCKKNFSYSENNKSNLPKRKTLRYIAENVTDFAWFASKDFFVHHDTININEKVVDIWSYFFPNKLSPWTQAIHHAKSAIQFFSKEVGPYPYPQVTVVECNRDGIGGMEYPMITLIDKEDGDAIELEKLIVHEFGHNWFQGILSNNERDEAWLDEGLTTYFENKYARSKGIFTTLLSDAPLPLFSDYEPAIDFTSYIKNQRRNLRSVYDKLSTYSDQEYVSSFYYSPAKGLDYAEKIIGEKKLKYLMWQYFETFKYGHPSKQTFLNELKKENITWYDSLFLQGQNLNISIQKDRHIPHSFNLRGSNHAIFHLLIGGYRKDKLIWNKIVTTSSQPQKIFYPEDSLDYILADPFLELHEVNRKDNILRLNKSPYIPKSLKFHLLPGIGHSLTKDIYVHPLISFNQHDGMLPSISIHNFTLPASDFTFGSIMGYGIKSKKINVILGADYTFFSNKKSRFIHSTSIGLDYRQLYIDDIGITEKFSPRLVFEFTRKSGLESLKHLIIRPIFFDHSINRLSSILEIKYTQVQKQHLYPYQFELISDWGRVMKKVYFNFHQERPVRYLPSAKHEWSINGGVFLNNNFNFKAPFSLSGTNHPDLDLDYKFDELLLSRFQSDNILNQQIFKKDAGFRSLSQLLLGRWLISGSYRMRINKYIPLRPYAQIALAKRTAKTNIYFTSGISLVILRNVLEVNFPILENKIVRDGYDIFNKEKYSRKINFLLDLKTLNPSKWIKSLGS